MKIPLIQVRDVMKDFRSLRPLRLQSFDLHEGESQALLGFDQGMAEVLVNLITGAILPDTGTITVFGQQTAGIANAETWVRTLDQFGLISERAVMLDGFTVEQNLALPMSLQIESMPADLRERVTALANAVGLPGHELASGAGQLTPLNRQRLRLGRALALDPRVLIAEHPNAPLSQPDTQTFAQVFKRVVADRRIAALVLTADPAFASSISPQVLTLQPATGLLKSSPAWRRWFS
jgi:ABC-type transporter Mla maintaining outer membrane lipid asymmetry ATPase subunit MlaF